MAISGGTRAMPLSKSGTRLRSFVKFADEFDKSRYTPEQKEDVANPACMKQEAEPVPHEVSDKSTDRQQQGEVQILADAARIVGIHIRPRCSSVPFLYLGIGWPGEP